MAKNFKNNYLIELIDSLDLKLFKTVKKYSISGIIPEKNTQYN